MKTALKTNSIPDIEGNQVSFVVRKEMLITPSDTNPLPENFIGANLYISIENTEPYIPVDVTLSLVDSPTVFIQRKLSAGYHPLRVHQIKATGTTTASVKYIAQL